MADDVALQECLDAAYHYLSYRPRSEAEIKQWLGRRGFAPRIIEKAIARLREQNLSDDLAFAQFWKESRLSSRPKSKRLIERELREKKVPAEIVEQVTEDIEDEELAYKLGIRRMPALAGLDYQTFHRRLSSYLRYRGFNYEVIRATAARLWQEKQDK
ncbi:MAG: regulatory protein RecX [Dehalococcoidia bacterium]